MSRYTIKGLQRDISRLKKALAAAKAAGKTQLAEAQVQSLIKMQHLLNARFMASAEMNPFVKLANFATDITDAKPLSLHLHTGLVAHVGWGNETGVAMLEGNCKPQLYAIAINLLRDYFITKPGTAKMDLSDHHNLHNAYMKLLFTVASKLTGQAIMEAGRGGHEVFFQQYSLALADFYTCIKQA